MPWPVPCCRESFFGTWGRTTHNHSGRIDGRHAPGSSQCLEYPPPSPASILLPSDPRCCLLVLSPKQLSKVFKQSNKFDELFDTYQVTKG